MRQLKIKIILLLMLLSVSSFGLTIHFMTMFHRSTDWQHTLIFGTACLVAFGLTILCAIDTQCRFTKLWRESRTIVYVLPTPADNLVDAQTTPFLMRPKLPKKRRA